MRKIALMLILPLLLTSCAKILPRTEPNRNISIYFVGDTPRGFKLFSEIRSFHNAEDLSRDVISDLISGKIRPRDPDYVNLWGSKNTLTAISYSGVVATLDFATISLNVGSEAEQRAIDQITWTFLTMTPKVKALRFTVNGKVVESFADHVDTRGEFTLAPAYEVLNPIQISSPIDGSSLTNPIHISGMACTFEANVMWRLLQGEIVIKEGATTASKACPDRSPWSVTLGHLKPGLYRIEAIERSAEDGSISAFDNKKFSVR